MEPNVANLWYFKFTLFDLTEFIVWNNKGHTTLGCNDIEIRESEFVAKTQFLYVMLCHLCFVIKSENAKRNIFKIN